MRKALRQQIVFAALLIGLASTVVAQYASVDGTSHRATLKWLDSLLSDYVADLEGYDFTDDCTLRLNWPDSTHLLEFRHIEPGAIEGFKNPPSVTFDPSKGIITDSVPTNVDDVQLRISISTGRIALQATKVFKRLAELCVPEVLEDTS
jgi:hypothetical protein